MKRLTIVALALAGCTSFDAIDRNTCGNGLLEAGEDCDSSDPSCVQCAVVCTTDDACPTTDYRCGVDGLCHAPGGAFAPPIAAGAFQVNKYRVTDVDHDGIGDALGVSKTSIAVRHGDATGAMSAVDSLVTPSQTGPAAFGDLDNDGSLDLSITTPDGLVSYTSGYGGMSALDVQSVITGPGSEPLDIRVAFAITPLTIGGFLVEPATQNVYAFAIDLFDAANGVVTMPCGASVAVAEFSPAMVDVYQANRDGALATDFVVAVVTGSGAGARLCSFAIHKDNLLTSPVVTTITPPGPLPLQHKPVLADLDPDADRCPGLVNANGGPAGLRYWDGVMSGGHCAYQAAAPGGNPLPAVTGTPASTPVVGHVALDPAPFLAAPDALVLGDGIYAYQPSLTSFSSIYHSTRELALAVSGDVNADGFLDAVLAAEGEDDLDVLYRQANGAVFQLVRLDTAATVTTITLGDYDGNGITDIAYTEQLSTYQRLQVSYGTQDRLLDPVVSGAFSDLTSVIRVAVPDSIDVASLAYPFGQIDDLVVLQPGEAQAPTLTFLHGSPQRTLLPYFDPRNQVGRTSTLFRGVVVGQFAPSPGGGVEHADLIGVAPSTLDGTSTTTMRGWLVPGTSSGLDGTESGGVEVAGLADCKYTNGGGPCVQDTEYLAWPLAPAKDVVIAIDRARGAAAMVDPWSVTDGVVAATTITALDPITEDLAIHSVHSADIDGDDAADLVATFAPRSKLATSLGKVLVCRVTAGVPESCEDVVPAIVATAPATTGCLDAAPARVAYRDPSIAPTAGRDLVVLCRDEGTTLYRVHHDADGYHAAVLAHTLASLNGVQVGDVTGDGVEDLVLLEGESGSQALVVYPQCTSRDTRCRLTSGAAGGAP